MQWKMMGSLILSAAMVSAAFAQDEAVPGGARAGGGNELDIEAGLVMPGRADVRIPGDSGTRISLVNDLSGGNEPFARIRYMRRTGERHKYGVLAALTTVYGEGVLDRPVRFADGSFQAGEHLRARYKFNSYRLIYRYLLKTGEKWEFWLGGAAKIRDAAIEFSGASGSAVKTDFGFVPLLSFEACYRVSDTVSLRFDGEALAAPQGRAEDVLLSVNYRSSDRVSWYLGYRILEGGADNDDVYTFSLFNYAAAGCRLAW